MIVLDAGHGGRDVGCVGNGFQEKDLTLRLARMVRRCADACGMPVGMVREADTFLPLSRRGAIARSIGATQVISLHFDMNVDPDVGRPTFYVRPDDQVARARATVMARCIPTDVFGHPLLLETSASDWRHRAHNVVSEYAPLSAMLIECAFLSKAAHTSALRHAQGLGALAAALTTGIQAASIATELQL